MVSYQPSAISCQVSIHYLHNWLPVTVTLQVRQDAAYNNFVIGGGNAMPHAFNPHCFRAGDDLGAFEAMLNGYEGIGTAVYT